MYPDSVIRRRLKRLRAALRKAELDALLIFDRFNTIYFSGFPCSNSVIVISAADAFFLTDFRYIEKAEREIGGFQVSRMTQNGMTELSDLLKKTGARRIGFEGGISFNQYQKFRRAAGRAALVESGNLIENIRAIKDDDEIATIASNQRLNERIFRNALRSVSKGDTEIAIRKRIVQEMTDRSVEEAFSSIIATGPNSSLPHAVPTARRVREGEFLLFDMGVKRNFYHSDMTRTVMVGSATPRHREIYRVVLDAQQAALEKIRAGAACRDVDAAARDHIHKAGYGDYFGHGLGHGVGLEIHEAPTLNPRSDQRLEEGMVVTVEPGVYVPGFGGVRIEDLVVVTRAGYRNLTAAQKQFRSIGIM